MNQHVQELKNAIQRLLNAQPDAGWVLDQFVVCLALQRVDSEGQIDSTAWVWAPNDQPDWQTDGLLRAATELREDCDIDTE